MQELTKTVFRPKMIVIGLVIAVSSIFLLLYINKFLYKSKATQPGLTVSFAPQTFSTTINTDSNLHVVLNPNDAGNKISAFDLFFVPGGNLNIVSFGTPISVGGSTGAQFTQQINSNNRLSYTISAGSDSDLPLHVEIPVVVKATTAGNGTLTIDAGANKSIVVGPIANYYYDLGTVPTGTYTFGVGGTNPSATVSPTGSSGNMTLNLKLKFQGILVKPADSFNKFTVKVTVVDLAGVEHPGSADFTADANGVWSGSVPITTLPGPGYKILVKGPKHLQKKVCVATPTETTGGTYRCAQGTITLAAGQNNLDFSGVIQLVGDLPEQGTAGQNGVIDAYDISYILNNLRSTDARALAIGDLNLDGIIDAQDYAGLLASLSIKYDEL